MSESYGRIYLYLNDREIDAISRMPEDEIVDELKKRGFSVVGFIDDYGVHGYSIRGRNSERRVGCAWSTAAENRLFHIRKAKRRG